MDAKEAWKVLEIATQPGIRLSRLDFSRCETALTVLKELIDKPEPPEKQKPADGK